MNAAHEWRRTPTNTDVLGARVVPMAAGAIAGQQGEEMENGAHNHGALVISLDFELLWGMRDSRTRESYGANILGGRAAIPRILELFNSNQIRATWATVGFLFCEDKDEMIASSPQMKPTYENPRLSNYRYFDEVGPDERRDPYYFGASLLHMIRKAGGQEIATHTLSHCYCLEPGLTIEQFAADLDAALTLASKRGIEISSIIFPRNQYAGEHLAVCQSRGIRTFRGNEASWAYRPSARARHEPLRRALRLCDSYFNIFGHHVSRPSPVGGLVNIPSSRFLRGAADRLGTLDRLRLRRVLSAMTAAACLGGVYHLWWHPHNFGREMDANFRFLNAVLEHFRVLSDHYGMASRCMGDFAEPAVD